MWYRTTKYNNNQNIDDIIIIVDDNDERQVRFRFVQSSIIIIIIAVFGLLFNGLAFADATQSIIGRYGYLPHTIPSSSSSTISSSASTTNIHHSQPSKHYRQSYRMARTDDPTTTTTTTNDGYEYVRYRQVVTPPPPSPPSLSSTTYSNSNRYLNGPIQKVSIRSNYLSGSTNHQMSHQQQQQQQQPQLQQTKPPQVVIRHPSSCSLDRSHAACTFSLLCFLANGVPVEGCEDNSSATCCYLKTPGTTLTTLAGSQSSNVDSNTFRSSTTTSTIPSSLSSESPNQSLSYRPSIINFGNNNGNGQPSSSTSISSNYYQPSAQTFRTIQYQTSESISPENQITSLSEPSSSSYLDTIYNTKPELIHSPLNVPYENKYENDYYINAIRRTRADNVKSIFQEIANRKNYARNYDVEDSMCSLEWKCKCEC